MKPLLFIILCICAICPQNGSASTFAPAAQRPAESAVSVTVPAQYVAARVRIECDEDDWGAKLQGIEGTVRTLAAAAEKEGLKLKVEQPAAFRDTYGKLSFSSSRSQEGFADVLLLAPLKEQTRLSPPVKQFSSIVAGLKPAKKVGVWITAIQLGIENPEEHRKELLRKIRSHVEESSRLLTAGLDYEISGVDEPVRVRQSGERTVEVYLPFRVTYAQKK
jgi:hypothetical protein